jgi:hypothetical protein
VNAVVNMVVKNRNEWFSANLLSLNFDRTYFMKFQTKNNSLKPACFVARVIKQFLSRDTLKMIYYAYFDSIMTYGLIFWGNS